MIRWLGRLIDSNEKALRRLEPKVARINQLESEFRALSDDALRAKTDEFKERLKSGATLDELLPEAFAAVREAAQRTIGQRHFDVQLMGGIILHQGKIAEMKTGEGKTLVATLPFYLNSLTGKGCHLATVNDYLARRDSYWMGPIYHALGVSVASIYPQQTPDENAPARLFDPEFESGDKNWPHFRVISRKEAYLADITYGTSSEFGFDYLRQNMIIEASRAVQRPLNYVIVDEVDNLLIDEARTPLIISAPNLEAGKLYQIFASLVTRLVPERDYELKEKERSVQLTDSGWTATERMLRNQGVLHSASLYDLENTQLIRHLRNALTAKEVYQRDREYVVKDSQVIIVDEFTGRLMLGRRYAEGLHQAIEAKERVKVREESQTFATVTVQNYFRMYDKLAGMTGTAVTEAEELDKIYNLEVVVIPTNKPMVREDYTDRIYRDEKAKFKAVIEDVEQLHREGKPVLFGTVSIEKSERLSELLKRKGIEHQVLNAKLHEREAGIIAQAGAPGAVTVATNMAGRGVDIMLGGNPEGQDKEEWLKKHQRVIELGGLHVIGTERHEARRIDNQLRGRAGRQGDPGKSRFYVSLEDDIMRRFGGDRIQGLMRWAGMGEDTAIENTLVNKAVENAQVRVEGYHFDIRKHLVDYDDVVNKQRELIYGERRKMLDGADLKANILSMVEDEFNALITIHLDGRHSLEPDYETFVSELSTIMPLPPDFNASAISRMKPKQIGDELKKQAVSIYEQREQEIGAGNTRIVERVLMLRILDSLWVEHLTAMEEMRQGIGLEAVGQRDPLVAYKRRGHDLFQNLMSNVRHDVVHAIFHVNISREKTPAATPLPTAQKAAGSTDMAKKKPQTLSGKKVGRNDPCPCGSGKKYKHCCGR